MTNKAAFFDIDGTLFRDSLLVKHFEILKDNDIIDDKRWNEEVVPYYEKFKNRKGAYEDYLDKVSIAYQEGIQGVSEEDLNKYAEIVLDREKDRIYLVTKKAIEKYLEDGYYVFFISGSPEYLVKPFGKLYGATHSIASKYIMKDGKFTGEVLPMWDSRNKIRSINYLKEKYDLNLKECHAYGDTNGDLSMMRSVGHAHIINPTFELLENCFKEKKLADKTKVHIERKDVNYEFMLKDMKAHFKQF